MSQPSLSAAVTAAGRLLRAQPGRILPAYLFASAVGAVARTPVLAGLGVAAAVVAGTARVEPILRAAAAAQRADGTPDSLPPAAADSVESLATPEVVLPVVVGVLLALLVGLLVRPAATAVTQTTVWAALDAHDDPLASGVRGAGRWRTFLGVLLVRSLLVIGLVGVPAVAAAALGVVNPALGVLGGVLVLAGAVVLLVVSAALAFVGPAVVVDRLGTLDAIRASVRFARRHPGSWLAFVGVAGGAYLVAGTVAGVAATVGVGRLGGALLPFVVAPVVDTVATGLYAGVNAPDERRAAREERSVTSDETTRAVSEPLPKSAPDDTGFQFVTRPGESAVSRGARGPTVGPITPRRTGLARFVAVCRDGIGAVAGAVARHPVAVLGGFVTFAVGMLVGWRATAPFGIRFDPPADAGAVFGAFPVDVFVNIAINNWLVAVSGSYGGVAFALPTVAAAVFNGVLVGALAGVFDPRAFLALVGPHGVIEIPALAVAWGVGLHLGRVGWRGLRGQTDAAGVARELRVAARVLVGIAVLLVVAAAVEAFLTPLIAERVV